MNDRLCEEFNKQINKEFYSAYLYFAMSTYFSEVMLDGFAEYMKKQASEELGHAQKIHDYLIQRNAKIALLRIESPEASWVNPVDVFEDALKHEKFVTHSIHNLNKLAKEDDDVASEIFLADFIVEQVEEEYTFGKLLEKVKVASQCSCGIQRLDTKVAHDHHGEHHG